MLGSTKNVLLFSFQIFSELGITKDNPAFSMINDSDEDVIYGSDEESRRPLNRARNDDDSDWIEGKNTTSVSNACIKCILNVILS